MMRPWLRKSQASIVTAAMMTAAVLAWPYPANTSVYSPNPINMAPEAAETTVFVPESPESAVPELQQASAPARLALAPRLIRPERRAPEARPEAAPEQEAAPRRAPLLPNLFGTVAVATSAAPNGWVEHVGLAADEFANCIATSGCGNSATWRNAVERIQALPLRDRLARANSFVNNAIRFRSDISATGQRDSWITPTELFRTGRGDCEDFALAKYWLLRAAGVPEEDMYIMVVSDLIARADHAYLAVRVGNGFVLLDSRSDAVQSPNQVDDITPLITVGARGAYLHGRPA